MKINKLVVSSVLFLAIIHVSAGAPAFYLMSDMLKSMQYGPPYPYNPAPNAESAWMDKNSILVDDVWGINNKSGLMELMEAPPPPDPSATNANGTPTYGSQYYHTNFPDPNARFWTIRTNDLLSCPEVIECLKLDITNQCAAMSARWTYRETKLESDRNWACAALSSIFEQATNGMSSNALWLVITGQVVYARYTNTFGY